MPRMYEYELFSTATERGVMSRYMTSGKAASANKRLKRKRLPLKWVRVKEVRDEVHDQSDSSAG